MSAGNRALLRVIAVKAPGSLDELACITGKSKSNPSRTLRTMGGYGLVSLERGERSRITSKAIHDRELAPHAVAQGKLSPDCFDPPHAATIRLALEATARSGPMGVDNIATNLNQHRIFTRDSGRWGIGRVRRILTRPT